MADDKKSQKAQKDELKTIIDEKKAKLKRMEHEVRDDVKNGNLPKSALAVEALHKIGVPTKTIQRGVVAMNNATNFFTKSDQDICKYYANYGNEEAAKKKEVSSIVKQVDKEEENVMDAKADLASSKLKYQIYKRSLKQADERVEKANSLSNTSGQDVKDGSLAGTIADYIGLDLDK